MHARLFAITLTMLFACGTNGDDDDDDGDDGTGTIDAPAQGACASIAGTWGITGTCGADTCDITQNGCATDLDCSGGSASYTGSITGNSFTYSGTTSGGTPATCNGTVTGGVMGGSCTIVGQQCSFTGQRL